MNLNFEIKSGFPVSVDRKRVWQKEIEILKACLNICNKHDIQAFVSDGTLLGAIRHKGFIPWDDDIDILMKRSEYERFIDIAKKELPTQYFLQYYKTEKDYPNGHLQIRDVNTTCFLKNSYSDLKRNKNCGIFIDIFPFDKVPENESQRIKFCKKSTRMKKLLCWKLYGTVGGIKGLIQKIIVKLYFLFNSTQSVIEKREKYALKFDDDISCTGYYPVAFFEYNKKYAWEEIDFRDKMSVDFEDVRVPVPSRYDEILKRQYGNYMEIPEDKNGTMHGQTYFDVDRPYTDYRDISEAEFDKLFDKPL